MIPAAVVGAVAVPTQSPGALEMEGAELVNSMSSDAGEIKGEVNGDHYQSTTLVLSVHSRSTSSPGKGG